MLTVANIFGVTSTCELAMYEVVLLCRAVSMIHAGNPVPSNVSR